MKIFLTIVIIILLVIVAIYAHTLFRGRGMIWRQILKELQIPEQSQIAELGLNYAGLFVLAAQQLKAPGKVVGVNIGKPVIGQREQQRITDNQVADRAKIIDGDLLNLPLQNRTYDYVFASFSFHTVKSAINRGRVVQEAARVLKPDGQLVIVDFGSMSDYEAALNNIGFHNVRIVSTGWIGWWGGPWLGTKVLVASR